MTKLKKDSCWCDVGEALKPYSIGPFGATAQKEMDEKDKADEEKHIFLTTWPQFVQLVSWVIL